jgi:hypothetical protein
VTLSRAAHRAGPYRTVPNHSTIMSPANRRNPDHTDSGGNFGWDVQPAYYRVIASHKGCTSSTTRALKIPPPALNLVIALRCTGLTRRSTTTTIKLLRTPGTRFAVAIAKVTARGRALPAGVVTFSSGKRKLVSVPLDAKRHQASAAIVLPSIKASVRAAYSGDAVYSASSSR